MYNWEIGITPQVKEFFTRIATKRFRGIVSQAKHGPGRPYWITPTLWTKMWEYWDTPEAQDKSSTASACRNSDRNGLGLAKHVAGQKSFLRVQQEMVMCLLTCFFTFFFFTYTGSFSYRRRSVVTLFHMVMCLREHIHRQMEASLISKRKKCLKLMTNNLLKLWMKQAAQRHLLSNLLNVLYPSTKRMPYSSRLFTLFSLLPIIVSLW